MLIESNLMTAPPEAVFQFQKSTSGIHFNSVSFDVNKERKTFFVVSNADGFVDIIDKDSLQVCKQLPIETMQCSLRVDHYLMIGSANKLYLVDLKKDFNVLSHIALSRHIFSICFMNSHNVVCGQ